MAGGDPRATSAVGPDRYARFALDAVQALAASRHVVVIEGRSEADRAAFFVRPVPPLDLVQITTTKPGPVCRLGPSPEEGSRCSIRATTSQS
jgi:hypothetical protein